MLTNENETQFLYALSKTLETGNDRLTRNGLTRAIFSQEMRFDLQKGFPLLTSKEVKKRSIFAELLWFLDAGKETGGRLSLEKLNQIQGKQLDAKNIWSHDQERFAKAGKAQFPGDCGRIYGAQWRNWRTYSLHQKGSIIPNSVDKECGPDTILPSLYTASKSIDQLANVINALKSDPFSRYHVVSAWNPAEIHDMCLAPCHMFFELFVRDIEGKKFLDLSMVQRSCDMFLGVPFNIASYALLQEMIAQCVDMTPGELVITLEDCHIYMAGINEDTTLDYAKGHEHAVKTQLERDPFAAPKLFLNPDIKDIDSFTMDDISIENYQHHPFIKATLL